MGGDESCDDDFQPTLILGNDTQQEAHSDGGGGGGGDCVVDARGDGVEKALSDATTVDDEEAGAGGVQDTASSKIQEHDDEVQPTLILGTQLLESPQYESTQIFGMEHAGLENPVEEKKAKSLASIRVQSLRGSAMAAYERLVSKLELEKDPQEKVEVDDSAKFVLQWGIKQAKTSTIAFDVFKPAPSLVEENLVTSNGGASCSASTPVSQTLKNISLVPALCSNNKKSTENRDKKSDSASPQQENSLDKIRKVLFDGKSVPGEDHRHPAQPLSAIVAPVRELSYLNSQDPGEESQAIALEALERLVSTNGDFSQEAQLGDFDVENKKMNVLASRIVQLQRDDPSSVYDFVTSQEDPLMKAGVLAAEGDQPAQVLDEEKVSEALEEQGKTPLSVATGSKPSTNKRKTAPPRSTARAPQVDPQTPKSTSNDAVSAEAVTKGSKSTARKRKSEAEKLIIADDTPRRSRRRPVKVLFSHSLGKDTIEEQKKVLKKLKFQVVEKAAECTHFITDRFLRTANMLEVLAAGKPVVDLAWIESCSVAGCAVDEKKFIVDDSKKEKELGFSMHSTYISAQQRLLLEGIPVHITPNTKPLDMVESVVKAAGGKIVKKNEATGGCLVISCEEDRKYCLPLIKKGIKIYSTEFLFSGVVSYHLDYSKNLLFAA
ncbi:BRCT-containing protein 1 [Selaginella moellendorffii]|uniref:BRCT-containing protein 1 n=1 Tax=Selaginella moellendorffii TaxID=88036 RepID=UPI000D1D0358|nr:BRCT-containing protein 1 [Selaginella moellendorffii]|eukprot:XP_024536584.1 BRCT-containing protein 1 [Selaginella moellendorffii]